MENGRNFKKHSGGGSDTLGTLIMIGIAIFLIVALWGKFLNYASWQIDVSVSPEGSGGTVSPFGHVDVRFNKGLNVTAMGSDGWAFNYWLFDGEIVAGSSPIINIPMQKGNSSHTLVAFFKPMQPVFEISPSQTIVKGASTTFSLTLKNNSNATLSNIRLKLNDPYGVFTEFWVYVGYSRDSYWTYRSYNSALNQFAPHPNSDYPGVLFGSSRTISAKGSATFACGGPQGGYGGGTTYCKVSSTVPSGTYHLTWEIQFVVVGGSFSNPPSLIIPWDVTILG